MATTQTVTCKTRLNKDDTNPVTSSVTIEFDDETATQKFAVRGVIVAWQSMVRDAGVIPTSDTVKVSELIKRTVERHRLVVAQFKVTPDSIANRMVKMSDDDFRATLEKMGLDPRVVKQIMEKQRTPIPEKK